jgi:serine/threonine protein kinase
MMEEKMDEDEHLLEETWSAREEQIRVVDPMVVSPDVLIPTTTRADELLETSRARKAQVKHTDNGSKKNKKKKRKNRKKNKSRSKARRTAQGAAVTGAGDLQPVECLDAFDIPHSADTDALGNEDDPAHGGLGPRPPGPDSYQSTWSNNTKTTSSSCSSNNDNDSQLSRSDSNINTTSNNNNNTRSDSNGSRSSNVSSSHGSINSPTTITTSSESTRASPCTFISSDCRGAVDGERKARMAEEAVTKQGGPGKGREGGTGGGREGGTGGGREGGREGGKEDIFGPGPLDAWMHAVLPMGKLGEAVAAHAWEYAGQEADDGYRHAGWLGEGAFARAVLAGREEGYGGKDVVLKVTCLVSTAADEETQVELGRKMVQGVAEAEALYRCLEEGGEEGGEEGRVVRLLGVALWKGSLFLALEYAEGGSLERWAGSLEEEECMRLAYDLVEAVATLHARRILHGDIKLGNVFMVKRGAEETAEGGEQKGVGGFSPVLGDLNGCIVFPREQAWEACVSDKEERAGTEGYAAPEVEGMETFGFPSDYFSLGVTLGKLRRSQEMRGWTLAGRKAVNGLKRDGLKYRLAREDFLALGWREAVERKKGR